MVGDMYGGGSVHGEGACMGVCMVGVCVEGGMHAGETATEAGGTHPTGMHSCLMSNNIITQKCSVMTIPSD